MARFVFRLETVLKQRRWEQQQRQRDLALREAHLHDLQQALKRLNAQVQSANTDMRENRLVGLLDLCFLAAHRRFLAAMQRGGMEVMQRIAIAQKQAADAQAALAEAAKRCKAIEKLKEKHLERGCAEQKRREMIELDEIGMQIGYANVAREMEGST